MFSLAASNPKVWLLTARLCNLKLVHVSQNTHQITGSCACAFSCLTLLARTSKSQLGGKSHCRRFSRKNQKTPLVIWTVYPPVYLFDARLLLLRGYFFLLSPSCLITSTNEPTAGPNLQHLSAAACLGFCRMSHQQEAVINVWRHLLDPTSVCCFLKWIELNWKSLFWSYCRKAQYTKWNSVTLIIIIVWKL